MTNQNLTLTAVNPDQLKDLIVAGIKEEFTELISQLIPQKKQEELLTRKEVCTILQCSMTTLWHWENRGLLCPIRIGRNVRYRKSEVESFIKSKS
ncbi:MAG: helix-turn-helix domain-containing protein [Gelidibacter sp.]|tara:strand:+ start:817 stop:1101 length:285 start_codon:yes stop_codon:yes gene_type:complete